MDAKSCYIWFKIILAIGGILMFLIVGITLYMVYKDSFSLGEEPENTVHKNLQNYDAMLQEQKRADFVTRLMERDGKDLLDDDLQLKKSNFLTMLMGKEAALTAILNSTKP